MDSGLADFGDVKVKEIYFRFDHRGTLKLAVLTEDSNTKSEKITYIAVSDKENYKPKFGSEELRNIHSHVFPDRGQNQKSQSIYESRKEIVYSITIGKERKVACDVIEIPEMGPYQSEQAKRFTLIKNNQENLKNLVEKLASKSYGQVISTTEEVLKYITGVYDKYKEGIKKQFEGRESSYHGFLAGFFMNFKYRFHLKLYLELFAGKGYSDIILLVRGTDKSLNAVPIIIELKAGTSRKNTPQGAMKQVQDYVKGFFSNFVRVITAAKEVVCIGLNFEMNRISKYSLYAQKFLDRKGNSVIEKLLGTEVANAEVIRTQLGYLYYGIVWSNGGSDNVNYVSRMILGQLVLISNIIKREKLGKHIFIYDQNDKMVTGSQRRQEAATESIADCVTTIVLTLGKKVLILNINEKNEFALRVPDNKGIPIENIREIQNVNDIQIQEITCNLYSTPSNKNPFDQYCNDNRGITVNTYSSLEGYKEGKEILRGNFTPIVENKKFKAALSKAIKSGEYNDYKKLFEEISRILHPFKSLISNEATFQAVLHGLFSSYGEDNIKVITEFQIGGGEKLDVMLVINATDGKKEYPPVGIELKFAKKGEFDKKEKEAKGQLTRYKGGEAYKVITDADKVKLMYAIFNKATTDEDSLIKIGNNFVELEVTHSSVVALNQQPGSSFQQSNVQKTVPSRVATR
ncbi:hypothetical protein [Wolbachia endosymbiont of Carposina sasakii]|uniref:hypothetical protein n=1 Tax=Wolbachia endosymbiont of Carposina sasakii TaxID=2591635 RepID=UPI001FED04A5|nr:hypothetical protein [Wolbachia endosymbiont of Carposina sasakii]